MACIRVENCATAKSNARAKEQSDFTHLDIPSVPL